VQKNHAPSLQCGGVVAGMKNRLVFEKKTVRTGLVGLLKIDQFKFEILKNGTKNVKKLEQ
jgi:predicted transcriptional regulator with HTH domain